MNDRLSIPSVEACGSGDPKRPSCIKGRGMKGILERALELAVDSASVGEVKQKLKAEGYEQIDAHLSGRLIRRQIIERLSPSDKKRRIRC